MRSRFRHALLSLLDAMRRDLERGAGFPWLIVCFSCGIWLYFELPREPQIWATVPLALVMIAASERRRRQGHAAFVMLALAALATGLVAADLRTWSVATPRLAAERTHTVTGWVEEVEPRATGYRLTVHPATISGVKKSHLPARIRVTGRTNPAPNAGDAVRFRARLSPPQGPVMPGGYAFDRAAFFERIGAYGFMFGRVELEAGLFGDIPLSLRLTAALASLRAQIGERIRQTYGGDSGAIAAALIVGERGAVSEDAQEDLRIAGLAHVLAISGMHMALVAGVVFFVIRAGLALSPALALHYPIRSWAAAGALVAATVYLAISGGSIATQRAYVMAAVIFLSMIAGRPAVTMRSVALAAAIVLMLTPEALLQPGFQMSFSAVIALIAAYRALFENRRRRHRENRATPLPVRSGLAQGLRLAALWGAGLIMTSLIAGLATGPVALAHFHRSSPLGLIANIAAMPLVSLIIMPLAVVSLVAMPYGLDPLPLYPMQTAIDAMLAIAAKIADWTPGDGVVGAIGDAPAILFTAGLLWLALWSSRWRLLGIAPVCLAVLAGLAHDRPDMLISEDGRTIALRARDGRLAFDIGPGGKFSAGIWLRADGDPAELRVRQADERTRRCDAEACVYRIGSHHPYALQAEGDIGAFHELSTSFQSENVNRGGAPTTRIAVGRYAGGAGLSRNDADAAATGETERMPSRAAVGLQPRILVSQVMRPEAFAEDCVRADIVVTALTAPNACADHAVVIDRAFLTKHGATAIHWPQQGLEMSPPTQEPVAGKTDVTPSLSPRATSSLQPRPSQIRPSRPGTHASPLPSLQQPSSPSGRDRAGLSSASTSSTVPELPTSGYKVNRSALRIVTTRSGKPRPWQMAPEP